jgi:hypothetical protein
VHLTIQHIPINMNSWSTFCVDHESLYPCPSRMNSQVHRFSSLYCWIDIAV